MPKIDNLPFGVIVGIASLLWAVFFTFRMIIFRRADGSSKSVAGHAMALLIEASFLILMLLQHYHGNMLFVAGVVGWGLSQVFVIIMNLPAYVRASTWIIPLLFDKATRQNPQSKRPKRVVGFMVMHVLLLGLQVVCAAYVLTQ